MPAHRLGLATHHCGELESSRDERRLASLSDTNREVEAASHQVDAPVGEGDLHGEARRLLHQPHEPRQEQPPAERAGRREPHLPCQICKARAGAQLGVGERLHVLFDLLEIGAALHGEPDTSRGALEQASTEPLFEVGDAAVDRRLGQGELRRLLRRQWGRGRRDRLRAVMGDALALARGVCSRSCTWPGGDAEGEEDAD